MRGLSQAKRCRSRTAAAAVAFCQLLFRLLPAALRSSWLRTCHRTGSTTGVRVCESGGVPEPGDEDMSASLVPSMFLDRLGCAPRASSWCVRPHAIVGWHY
jgi:hypothetical protein